MLDKNKHVFVEGESRKVGKVFIPEDLANTMKKGIFVLLVASLETRIKRIINEYQIHDNETFLKINEILMFILQDLSTYHHISYYH